MEKQVGSSQLVYRADDPPTMEGETIRIEDLEEAQQKLEKRLVDELMKREVSKFRLEERITSIATKMDKKLDHFAEALAEIQLLLLHLERGNSTVVVGSTHGDDKWNYLAADQISDAPVRCDGIGVLPTQEDAKEETQCEFSNNPLNLLVRDVVNGVEKWGLSVENGSGGDLGKNIVDNYNYNSESCLNSVGDYGNFKENLSAYEVQEIFEIDVEQRESSFIVAGRKENGLVVELIPTDDEIKEKKEHVDEETMNYDAEVVSDFVQKKEMEIENEVVGVDDVGVTDVQHKKMEIKDEVVRSADVIHTDEMCPLPGRRETDYSTRLPSSEASARNDGIGVSPMWIDVKDEMNCKYSHNSLNSLDFDVVSGVGELRFPIKSVSDLENSKSCLNIVATYGDFNENVSESEVVRKALVVVVDQEEIIYVGESMLKDDSLWVIVDVGITEKRVVKFVEESCGNSHTNLDSSLEQSYRICMLMMREWLDDAHQWEIKKQLYCQRSIVLITDTVLGTSVTVVLHVVTYITMLPLLSKDNEVDDGPNIVEMAHTGELVHQIEDGTVKTACYMGIKIIVVVGQIKKKQDFGIWHSWKDASVLFEKGKMTSNIDTSRKAFEFDLTKVRFMEALDVLDTSHNQIFGRITEHEDFDLVTEVEQQDSLKWSWDDFPCQELDSSLKIATSICLSRAEALTHMLQSAAETHEIHEMRNMWGLGSNINAIGRCQVLEVTAVRSEIDPWGQGSQKEGGIVMTMVWEYGEIRDLIMKEMELGLVDEGKDFDQQQKGSEGYITKGRISGVYKWLELWWKEVVKTSELWEELLFSFQHFLFTFTALVLFY